MLVTRSGRPNVSKVNIGGKSRELGIGAIGIAEHIDPANFSTDETAIVLLELLWKTVDYPKEIYRARSTGPWGKKLD